jgi:predicted permease
MDFIRNDLRFALRTLRKQPAFTLTVLATLGLAVGAATAIFSVVESTLLRPLPFQNPDRIAFLWGVAGPQRAIRGGSIIEIQDWARLNHTFDAIAIYDETSLNLRTDEGADRVPAEMVSASYFPILGATAQLGRVFNADEDRVPDADPVVVISDAMWTARFNRDPAIIGHTLILNDKPFTVLGVMRPGFKGASFATDVWFPSMMVHANGGPTDLTSRGNRWLGAVGRLKDGVSLETAQTDLQRVAAQLAKDFPASNTDRSVQLSTLRDSYLGTTRTLLLAVFAGVGLLLLIACANIIGLQLVRANNRRREFALRVAIGAERRRLMQQLVVEGLVMAAGAAVVGLIVASAGLQALVALTPAGLLPLYATPSIDPVAFGFAFLVSVGCGVIFGMTPALQAARVNLTDSLKEGSRGSAGFGRGARLGSQQTLVVVETAVAIILLVGAGLYMRSLRKELSVPLHFDPTGITRASFTFPRSYTPEARLQFVNQLQARLGAIPSVESTALSTDVPLSGGTSASIIYILDGDRSARYYRHSVTPNYFQTLRVPLIGGRLFTADDRDGTPPVAVINASMAKRFWPNETAVGKTVRLGDAQGPEVRIVGVVEDVRQRDLTTALATSEPDIYYPLAQRVSPNLQIAVRAALATDAIAASMRRELASLDPTIPLYGIGSLEMAVASQTASSRFASTMLSVFGAAALLLTGIGLYGVLAFLVSLRRRELGIRLALGATQARLSRGVMAHGLRLVLVGAIAGLLAASLLTKWIATQLYGIRGNDPLVFGVVPVVLLVIAAIASWAPARRAGRIDPQLALRAD